MLNELELPCLLDSYEETFTLPSLLSERRSALSQKDDSRLVTSLMEEVDAFTELCERDLQAVSKPLCRGSLLANSVSCYVGIAAGRQLPW